MTVAITASHVEPFKQAVLDLSPVLFMGFDETSGTFADWSKNRHVGTATGGVTYAQADSLVNESGYSVLFDGSTGYITVPDAATLDLGDSLTIICASKVSAYTGGDFVLVSKGNNAFQLLLQHFTGPNRMILQFQKQGSSVIVTATGALVSYNTWEFYGVSKSGGTTALYVNGTDRTGTVTNATLADTSTSLNIGRSSGVSGYHPGYMDCLIVFNYSLPAAQHAGIYNLWNGAYQLSATSLGTASTLSATSLGSAATVSPVAL